jgi:hypothetical protein
MPANDGLRSDDNQPIFPLEPDPLCRDPKQFVDGFQFRPRMATLEHRELLSEREVLQ